MGRKVFITGDMSIDERLIAIAEQDPQVALLWPWLLTIFDDWGRAEASPRRLKAQVFPMNSLVTVDLIEKALELYAQQGLLQLYEVNGKSYMAIPQNKWYKYQTHMHRTRRPGKDKMESNFPAPPTAPPEMTTPRGDARGCAGENGDARVPVPSPSPSPSPSEDIKTGGFLTESTAQSAGADDKPLTNKDLIAELVEKYRSIEGIQPAKGDFAFIGALYNRHGYHEVLDGLHELEMVLATQSLEKPLVYLKAIIEKRVGNTRDRPAGKRIPRAFASLLELNAELEARERSRSP